MTIEKLKAALGAAKVLTDAEALNARRHDYWMVSTLRDRLGKGAAAPAVVVRPASVADVQATVRIAVETGTPLVPFGLGSGVVGGVETWGQAILLEAAFSFLGFGVQPPLPSWGLMIAEGKRFMFAQPWMTLIPGAAICVLVLAINLLGDGIRDATAPEGRR